MTKYPIEVFWSDEDEGYIAVVPDLPACNAWGKNEPDAIREAHNAIAAWIGELFELWRIIGFSAT